jgi:hypothetical protein
MSGEWKRSMARLLRHRQPKGPETDRPNLNHRVTPRLYRNVGGSLDQGQRADHLRVFTPPLVHFSLAIAVDAVNYY